MVEKKKRIHSSISRKATCKTSCLSPQWSRGDQQNVEFVFPSPIRLDDVLGNELSAFTD